MEIELLGQLVLATILGSIVGLEREFARKTAGMRTFALVSLGSALFAILSREGASQYSGATDPTRIAAQIVTGVGFIGAGLIIFDKSKLRGVTTAAGLWVAAAIGTSIGFGFYALGIFASLLAVLVFTFMWQVEEKVVHPNRRKAYSHVKKQ